MSYTALYILKDIELMHYPERTSPNLNCAQLRLPSPIVHNLFPLSLPAAPTPT